ncbi:acyclic terpene utilization AtuA family protein [Modestobacter excelsi]|uniref:acyclic terpene utilization AtuA family protein n=1 Tax=Modestobacter excelsi TaxID=2213161 RepID=UPI00110CA796|nr:acyclic terpene utilization AtuA family protein [Modestobacter excelsi]
MTGAEKRPVRIANCSGYYGDRFEAAREMVDGGQIDVLTGDWLAELTMFILSRDLKKDPRGGYARTFVRQMEAVMGTCLEKGIKVVSNAGGLNPQACADALREVAERQGLSPRIAVVAGDDILPRIADLQADGHPLAHMDTGAPLGDVVPVSANAYLGGWAITEALGRGADIVVTGRVTDAAVVIGPAAWYHGWERSDWDAMAGACAAGHVIECGCQATGGNYAFFTEVPGLERPGFPIAEIAADGSAVITKHEGTGGAVTVGTVTAQFLYEIEGPRYPNPDVVARFDTVVLEQEGPDRVRISGARGEPAPPDVKVSINRHGGYRSGATFGMMGLQIEEKAALAERQIWAAFDGGTDHFDVAGSRLRWVSDRTGEFGDIPSAQLSLYVKDADAAKVARFVRVVNEMSLSTYAGKFTQSAPSKPTAYAVHWPALLPATLCSAQVEFDGETFEVSAVTPAVTAGEIPAGSLPPREDHGPTRPSPLGAIVAARSGDKGGNANLGLWVGRDEQWAWLCHTLTTEAFVELYPEFAGYPIDRFVFPNIRGLNFVIRGLLGEGVASSVRYDPQAKSLGEVVRARVLDIPVELLPEGGPA